ncbi:putative Multidrug resistance-associated protein 1 [Hypsibius exemplaris]|uniref:Multidrug resistance-associated protein 1 n=1 Tax=Hypsibius exemplaris TaxID=2072580 RepID=A0A9X6NMN1_HYPEX|nr:putative Multidrug resistance-associated protein 1 [Hypsibius exemplaris]
MATNASTLPLRWTYNPFSAGFCNDPLWDSAVTWDTTNPNFTECFQKTALSWIPCGFLWLALPLLLRRGLQTGPTIRRWTYLSTSKIILSGILALLCLMEFFHLTHIWRTAGLAGIPDVDIVDPLVKAGTFFLSMWYVYVYRRRARPSSAILFVFWLAMLIAGIVRYRTLIERATVYGISDPLKFGTQMVYLPVVLSQFLLSCFAETFPEVSTNTRKPCPEQLSSVPSRLTFWWFTR